MSITTIAIFVGIALAGVLTKRIVQRQQPHWASGLGSVSQQWVTEHRLAETSDHG